MLVAILALTGACIASASMAVALRSIAEVLRNMKY